MCSYIQPRAPGLCSFSLSSCQRRSKYHAYGFLQFTCSKPSTELSLAGDVTWRSIVEASVLIRWTNSPLPIYNFSSSFYGFLVLMSCWTDFRLPKVGVSLDFTERINTVTMNKYGWHGTWQESIPSREVCEPWKLPVKPPFLAWQVSCFRWMESAIWETTGYWSWTLLLWELVSWLLQWNQLIKLFD